MKCKHESHLGLMIQELERHIEMLKKNHRHELGIERARAKEYQRQLEEMKEANAKLETLVKVSWSLVKVNH